MMLYTPRDIGCNRYPVYNSHGAFIREECYQGFRFSTMDDFFIHPLITRLHHKDIFAEKNDDPSPYLKPRQDFVVKAGDRSTSRMGVVGWITELT